MKNIIYSGLFLTTLLLIGSDKTAEEEREEIKIKKEEIINLKSEFKTELDALNEELNQLTKEDIIEDDNRSIVYVDKVQNQAYASYVKVNGVVATDQNVMVMPEISGILRSINVRRGQKVTIGQVLGKVDNTIMLKNLAELKSQLNFATIMFDKQSRLYKQKVGTEIQYLQAKNNKESLENSIETLKSQLSKSNITSPISGKIDEIFPKQGELVAPGSPVVRIVSTSNVYVDAEVSEAYIDKVNMYDELSVFFPFLDKNLEAKITYKGNFINPNNRTFKIHIGFKGAKMDLPPNMLAVVQLRDVFIENAIVIPSKLIKNDGKSDFVYTVKDKKVLKRSVQSLSMYDGETAVKGQLKVGDQLVVKGYNTISKGEEVIIKTEK